MPIRFHDRHEWIDFLEASEVARRIVAGLATALCPGPEDIAVAKLCAWREKDQALPAGEVPDTAPARDELSRRLAIASVDTPPA